MPFVSQKAVFIIPTASTILKQEVPHVIRSQSFQQEGGTARVILNK